MSDWILDLTIRGRLTHVPSTPPAGWSYAVGPVVAKGAEMPLDVTINDTQKVKVTLVPNGPVDGVPLWEVMTGLATVMPDADGMSAYLISEDNVSTGGSTSTVEVSADVDMGAGNVTLTDQINMHVTEAQATSLGLTVASPEPK
jgi:hypothetical protein